MTNATERARAQIDKLSPGGLPYRLNVPLHEDESRWFTKALDEGVVRFQECEPTCPRLRRRKASGPDEFAVRTAAFRHLFSAPMSPTQRLNREYIPHIAAYARAILEFGYDSARAAFSAYRSFQRDQITKRAGVGYETDGEFYDSNGSIHLHLEVKTKPAEVDAIARQLDQAASLTELPPATRKEIEYVLELTPRYFWLIGPGTVDPARHVFAVTTQERTARFERVGDVPPPPVARQ